MGQVQKGKILTAKNAKKENGLFESRGGAMTKLPAVVFLVLLTVIGCQDDTETLSITGRITYLSFEGGFYGIVADDGNHYDPENLDIGYQENGLRVSFEGFETYKATTRMWGRTIYLTRIHRLQ